MRAWALKDNLDADAFGWWFGQHRENAEVMQPLRSEELCVWIVGKDGM